MILLLNQSRYFWQIIRKRFFFWLLLLILIMALTGLQYRYNPRVNLNTLFFYGVSASEISAGHVSIPPLWFFYLLVPHLILLNALQELTKYHSQQLWGLQFSKIKLASTHCLLILLISLLYEFISVLALMVTSKIQIAKEMTSISGHLAKLSLPFLTTLLLCIASLLLLQAILNLVHPIIGITLPILILVITIFKNWRYNPINSTMLSRILPHTFRQDTFIFLLLISLLVSLYIHIYRHQDLN